MAKVLVTGGTGFVAHWLKKTKPDDISIYCIGRPKYDSMEWFNEQWDAIVHLAPIAPTQVLDCAKKNNARMLYGSSGIVYHPENNTPYRIGKINGEQECLETKVNFVIARMFTFWGEKLDENKAITVFQKAVREGLPIKITGNGNTIRSYMHGSELGFWLWTILRHGETRKAYDVGSDVPVTMMQLADLIVKGKTPKPEIIIEGGKDPMPYYLPEDTRKTRELLTKPKVW